MVMRPKPLIWVHELYIVARRWNQPFQKKKWSMKKSVACWKQPAMLSISGRGQDCYVAMEASHRLKEISYIQCEGFAAGELKHGTIADRRQYTSYRSLVWSSLASHTVEMKWQHIRYVSFVQKKMSSTDDLVLISISMVVPAQLIAYLQPFIVDSMSTNPRNLAKSVTVE